MISNLSVTWSSALVFSLLWLFQNAGLSISEGEITTFIVVAGKLFALAGVFYGRWRQGDIKNVFGAKRVY